MNSYNNNTRFSTRTPFCKVCKDAGKSEAQYTSHYVKDRPGPQGKVCCPTLLSLECRYCHEMGHTPSCCPVLARHKMEDKIEQRVQQKMTLIEVDGFTRVGAKKAWIETSSSKPTSKPEKVSQPRNAFAILEQEQVYDDASQVEEFPEFVTQKTTQQPVLSGWAAVASAPTPQKVLDIPKKSHLGIPVSKTTGKKLSWADMCDSDFDSDDEDLEEPAW